MRVKLQYLDGDSNPPTRMLGFPWKFLGAGCTQVSEECSVFDCQVASSGRERCKTTLFRCMRHGTETFVDIIRSKLSITHEK